ncbi:MAG: DUF2911 domain-containing protein [Terriglobia bacterium]
MKIKRLGLRAVAGVSALVVASAGVSATGAPRGTTRASFGKVTVTIRYGRPSLKGRQIRQMIEPGQLWRAGADAPTTIQSNADLNFGGIRVPPGKHILILRYIRPDTWSLVVSKAPAIDYTPDARIAEILMHLEKHQTPTGELTISVVNAGGQGKIEIAWGACRLWGEFTPAH